MTCTDYCSSVRLDASLREGSAEPAREDRCQRGRDPVIRDDGSIEIPLTKGRVSPVSPESYQLVKDRRWYAMWNRVARSFYALGCGGTTKTLCLHRVVLRAPAGMLVDHINHDTLDNRLANVRLATASNNQHNSRTPRNNTSGFKGVNWYRERGVWRARISVAGKRRTVGSFSTAEEAALAYDAAARSAYGEFALTNASMARGNR